MIGIRYWILVGLLALGACSSGQQPGEKNTDREIVRITDQAIAKWDLQAAAARVFPPGYVLEEQPTLPLNCTAGGTLYGIHFIVRQIDPKRNEDYFDRMKQFWLAEGWHVENDARPYDMFMNADKDDYLTSISGGFTGQVAIGTSTPCI